MDEFEEHAYMHGMITMLMDVHISMDTACMVHGCGIGIELLIIRYLVHY